MRILLFIASLLLATLAQAGLLDALGQGGKPAFLPPDQAFAVQATVRDATTVQFSFNITPGYYLYRDKIRFTPEQAATRIGAVELPPGETKDDPNFGRIQVFHQSFQTLVKLAEADPAQPLKIKVRYQGCSEAGLCYPPIDKTLELDLMQSVSTAPPQTASGAAPDNENTRIADLFRQGNFWLVVSFFFGAGLLLAFTPCVFPMIPILSGIIVGRGEKLTHAHAFWLSLAYVLGMALTYAAAGVLAGFSGNLISNALQTPWVLGSFAALFVVLSLSMFGYYELQLPAALQGRLTDTSNKLHGGHLSGVFAMGVLSALIMGPCVAAPLAGALLYIGQTHDALLGGAALFAMGLGMGAPLLLIGSSAGVLLPKAGAWMESVKRFFGVMLLGLAIWIVSPVIPVALHMALWAALLLFTAIHLHALDRLPDNAGARHKTGKAAGILALLLGIAYLIGALSGATDMLKPLAAFGRGETAAAETLQFERVRSLAELDARVAGAKGQTVMLDFYADWCVSCKEMERFTFADPQVRARLNNTLLLQADVTANSADDQALLQRYELFGPPATLFFNAAGEEQSAHRVIGYQDAAQFLRSLQQAGI